MIAVIGESGSGKTTSARTLDPNATYYIDCDKKGAWHGKGGKASNTQTTKRTFFSLGRDLEAKNQCIIQN